MIYAPSSRSAITPESASRTLAEFKRSQVLTKLATEQSEIFNFDPNKLGSDKYANSGNYYL